MIEELDRAASILNELLYLAQNKPVELVNHDLNTIIKKILPLIHSDALKLEMKIDTDLSPEPLIDLANEKEIRQLVLNLVRNGLEAMEPGGCLSIKTSSDGLKNKITLEVRDQGCGISSDVLNFIGTPFFTTKENGTGLGISVCYSIVQRHNAEIKFDTNESGTTFFIYFPFSETINSPA